MWRLPALGPQNLLRKLQGLCKYVCMKEKIYLLLWLCNFSLAAMAQQSVGLHYQLGRSIPNAGQFPDVEQFSQDVEFSWLIGTRGEPYTWAALYRYPSIGLQASWQSLGNPAVLGQAFALAPQMSFQFQLPKQWAFELRTALGLAYLSKRYNSFTNPLNEAIGSNINAFFSVKSSLVYHLAERSRLCLGLGINHYSNARVQNPNLGINVLSATLGFRYILAPAKPITDSIALPDLPIWQVRAYIKGGFATSERGINGRRYPVGAMQIGLTAIISQRSKIHLGFEYMHDEAARQTILHRRQVERLSPLFYTRYSLILGHTFLFGHWGLVTEGGIYLREHQSMRSQFLLNLGINWYSRNYFEQQNWQFFIGPRVRTYLGEAEMLELAVGLVF